MKKKALGFMLAATMTYLCLPDVVGTKMKETRRKRKCYEQ